MKKTLTTLTMAMTLALAGCGEKPAVNFADKQIMESIVGSQVFQDSMRDAMRDCGSDRTCKSYRAASGLNTAFNDAGFSFDKTLNAYLLKSKTRAGVSELHKQGWVVGFRPITATLTREAAKKLLDDGVITQVTLDTLSNSTSG